MKNRSFFEDVWDVVRLIPPGRVSTYGAIAKYLGTAKSSRMVGWAMNASHRVGSIPAHRVVNRSGVLTGKHHFQHPEQMAELLKAEGIEHHKDRIINMQAYFWDPNTEIPCP